jgi:hypothetical protein
VCHIWSTTLSTTNPSVSAMLKWLYYILHCVLWLPPHVQYQTSPLFQRIVLSKSGSKLGFEPNFYEPNPKFSSKFGHWLNWTCRFSSGSGYRSKVWTYVLISLVLGWNFTILTFYLPFRDQKMSLNSLDRFEPELNL